MGVRIGVKLIVQCHCLKISHTVSTASHVPVTSVLGRLRPENLKFESSESYTVRLGLRKPSVGGVSQQWWLLSTQKSPMFNPRTKGERVKEM